MVQAYPIILEPIDDGGFLVYCPDFAITTEGNDSADALYMARDAISLMGMDLIEDHKPVPVPSDLKEIKTESANITLLVDVDFEKYRREFSSKSVRKNCTLPEWLNEAATEKGLNFSQILQEGLKEALGL